MRPSAFVSTSMVLWIGVDDTDSLRGMCTTFLATEIVRELTVDYDLIGFPRLVRLNPNIPWKTRGNGAISLRLGRGRGHGRQIGEFEGEPLVAYSEGVSAGTPRKILSRTEEIVEAWAAFEDPTTNPGIVVLSRRPPPSLYWHAVRGVVPLDDVLQSLRGRGAWKGYKNRRGLIGAAAAVSWRPRDRTYELLAYRKPSLWRKPRQLQLASVLEMDARFTSTFNNVDRREGHVVIAPHSPCPVLYGIRGDAVEDLPAAQAMLEGEAPERWLIVETNQGTDDHIVTDDWTRRPYSSTSVVVEVVAPPCTLRGGHVLVPVRGHHELELAFYEPSKSFRRVGRALLPGDRLRVWGSYRDDLRTLNVEKVRIQVTVPQQVRVANPVCAACGKSMKSQGRGKGFRCVHGHERAPPCAGRWTAVERLVKPGWYEPPVFARRHLSKPVKRVALHESRRDSVSPQAPEIAS